MAGSIFNAEHLDQVAPVVLEEIERLVHSKISWFSAGPNLRRTADRPGEGVPISTWAPFLEAWRRWSHTDSVLT